MGAIWQSYIDDHLWEDNCQLTLFSIDIYAVKLGYKINSSSENTAAGGGGVGMERLF